MCCRQSFYYLTFYLLFFRQLPSIRERSCSSLIISQNSSAKAFLWGLSRHLSANRSTTSNLSITRERVSYLSSQAVWSLSQLPCGVLRGSQSLLGCMWVALSCQGVALSCQGVGLSCQGAGLSFLVLLCLDSMDFLRILRIQSRCGWLICVRIRITKNNSQIVKIVIGKVPSLRNPKRPPNAQQKERPPNAQQKERPPQRSTERALEQVSRGQMAAKEDKRSQSLVEPLLHNFGNILHVVIKPDRVPHVMDDDRGLVVAGTGLLQIQARERVYQFVAARLDQQVRRSQVFILFSGLRHHAQQYSHGFRIQSAVVKVGVVFRVAVQAIPAAVSACLAQQLLVRQEQGEQQGQLFQEGVVLAVLADGGTQEDHSSRDIWVFQGDVERHCAPQTHPRQKHLQIRVFVLDFDDVLLAGSHQFLKRLDTASPGSLGLTEVDEIVASHNKAVPNEVTCQLAAGAGVAVEGVEEDDYGFGFDGFWGLPSVCHEFGAVVVPVVVNGVIGYLSGEIDVCFFEAVYSLKLVLAIAQRDAGKVLVVGFEFIAMAFDGFGEEEGSELGEKESARANRPNKPKQHLINLNKFSAFQEDQM